MEEGKVNDTPSIQQSQTDLQISANDVYYETANQLQAVKSQEVFNESAKSITPKIEESQFEIDEKEKQVHQKHLLARHLGKDFGNMSIVFVAFVFFVLFAQLSISIGAIFLGFLLAAILIIISIATLFLVYINGGMAPWWQRVLDLFQGGSEVANFISKIYVSFPFVLVLSIFFSILSIVFTSKSGVYKSKGRIICSSIFGVIAAIMLLIILAGVVKA